MWIELIILSVSFVSSYFIWPHIHHLLLLNRALCLIYPNWYSRSAFMCKLLYIYIWQSLNKCVTKIGSNEYELCHVLDSELVRIKIKRINPVVIDVQNEEGNSLSEEEMSFFKFEVVYKFSQLPLYIYYDDGTMRSITLHTIKNIGDHADST